MIALNSKALLTYSLMFLLLSTFAVLMDASSANAQESESIPSGIGAASGSNRFVVWQDNTPGNWDILFKRSTDNGAMWKSTVNLSKNAGDSEHPQIAVSGSNVYIIWAQWNTDFSSQDIILRRSTDNGATWQPKVNLSNDVPKSFDPVMTALGEFVFVTWTSRESGGDAETLFRRSGDNGTTWKPVVNISGTSGDGESQITVNGANVYVIWNGYTEDDSLHHLMFRRSTDNGATWKSQVELSDGTSAPEGSRIAVSGANVYTVWSDQTENSLDIFFRRSTDGGATWKSAKVLQFNAGSSEHPQIAVSGSNVYVVWEDKTPAPGIYDIFYMRSTDSGATWGPRVNLSNNAGHSHHPQIAVSGANVYVVWIDATTPPDATLSSLSLLMRRSADSGATWKSIQTLRSDVSATIPDLAVSGPNVYVTWSEDNGEWPDVFFRRSNNDGATWTTARNISNNQGESIFSQLGT